MTSCTDIGFAENVVPERSLALPPHRGDPNLLSILNTGMSAIGWALLHTTVMSCDMIVANSGGLSGAIGHALLKRERYGA